MNPLIVLGALFGLVMALGSGPQKARLRAGRSYRFTGMVRPPIDLDAIKAIFPFFAKFTSVGVEKLPEGTRITWDDTATFNQEMSLPKEIFKAAETSVSIVKVQEL